MLTRSHLTLATALAIAALAAPAATAMPADPSSGDPRQADMHASTVTPQDARGEHAASLADPGQADMHASTAKGTDVAAPDQQASTVTTQDVRGENAASLADDPAATVDLRTPDAAEPFTRPVVVEVDGEPSSPGFDWTAAIIGLAAGLAFAVLAGTAVSGSRRYRSRPRTV
jgi:hypothetical protein